MLDCNLDSCPFACEGYVRECPYTKEEAAQMPTSKEIEYTLEHWWDGE
jgi:hypothetical protein